MVLAKSRGVTVEIWYEFLRKNNIFSLKDSKYCYFAVISIMISFFLAVVYVNFMKFILAKVTTTFLIVCKEHAS